MMIRSLYRLAFFLLLAAGAAALAALRGGQAAWFLAWLLTGAGAVSLSVFLFSLMKAEVVRSGDNQTLFPRDELTVELKIRHMSLLPVLWMSVADRFVREADGQLYTVRKRVYPGWRGRFTVRYRISGLERGSYRYTGTELLAGDCWGLVQKRRLLPGSGGFTVLPEGRAVLPVGLPKGAGGDETEGASPFRPSIPGHGVRPYENGDPLHRVHWKSTARRDGLMTRVDEPALERRFQVMLDGSASAYQGRPELFEQAIRWAAGILQAAGDIRAMAGLACNGKQPIRLPPHLPDNGLPALRLLAVLETGGEQSFAELLMDCGSRPGGRDDAVVAVTPVIDFAVERALAQLCQGGRQVFVYHLLGARLAGERELEQKRRLESAGCRVHQIREARIERTVRLHAESEGA
ncbi:DUF58 domain-containing protein [Paenibacillus sp. YN15]|uniref:DUF58 domain-containing protein n=1 Tax=Paenibacillus sp. YN15 TaxID=1742774 RepID=UPI0015EBA1F1|nr:DUF58 domain-containing protein [Paenibacillus sp. YN15]